VQQLEARPEQVLHATYLGRKHPAADVENVVLFNIDDAGRSFAGAARFGLRFELAARCPTSPIGKQYPCGYRYELVPRSAGFRHWHDGRELASWDWIDLRAFSGEKKLEQVWLALARSDLHCASPGRAPGAPFAVLVTIRPPRGITPVLGGLVKGIFDGVVAAFQAHADRSNVAVLAQRVSHHVTASPREIEALLLNQEKAVLGVVPRLLHVRDKGVQWAPADNLCVAGELLTEEPDASTWAIKGRIVEIELRSGIT